MNPEEEFWTWCEKTGLVDDAMKAWSRDAWHEAWEQAFRLGHHQGMTRAAEICGSVENNEDTVIGKMKCKMAILDERDKDK